MDAEQNFVSDYNGTKATETLHVVELAERILSFLDIRAIIKTTRVCKQLRDTLATSSKLRTLTFLAPEPPPAALEELVARNKKDLDWNPPASLSGIAFNPLVFESVDRDHDGDHAMAMLNDTNVLSLPSSDYALEYDGLRIDKGEDHSTLSIDRRIDDPMVTEVIGETPGSARDMLLVYHPKDMQIELTLAVHEDQSFSFEVTILVTVSGKITLGGLCEVLNLLWACMPAPEFLMEEKEEVGDGVSITQRYLRGKARELGNDAMQWMKGDAKYFLTMEE
ncbi:hypothetical protein HII31_06529 [Pseudocercospora fuligena]|uniref:F-box domain-containing protein n=1 Tax=Pseudocercospora fuligena TaxID=685502 RepID=A0A8H6RJS2_9PEZI|nr:hypothetical protein HII31_06529 [Pseudocercospora fuligena]